MQSKTILWPVGLLLCLAPAALAAGTNATLAALAAKVSFGKFVNCTLAAKGERTYCSRSQTVGNTTSICTYDCGLLGACKDDVVGHLLKPTLIQCGGGGPATPTFPAGCSAAQVTLSFEEDPIGINSTGEATPQPADGASTQLDGVFFAYDNVAFGRTTGRRSVDYLNNKNYVYPNNISNRNFARGKTNFAGPEGGFGVAFSTTAKVYSVYVGVVGATSSTNITIEGRSIASSTTNCTTNVPVVDGAAGQLITFPSCVTNLLVFGTATDPSVELPDDPFTITMDDITACQAMVPSFGP